MSARSVDGVGTQMTQSVNPSRFTPVKKAQRIELLKKTQALLSRTANLSEKLPQAFDIVLKDSKTGDRYIILDCIKSEQDIKKARLTSALIEKLGFQSFLTYRCVSLDRIDSRRAQAFAREAGKSELLLARVLPDEVAGKAKSIHNSLEEQIVFYTFIRDWDHEFDFDFDDEDNAVFWNTKNEIRLANGEFLGFDFNMGYEFQQHGRIGEFMKVWRRLVHEYHFRTDRRLSLNREVLFRIIMAVRKISEKDMYEAILDAGFSGYEARDIMNGLMYSRDFLIDDVSSLLSIEKQDMAHVATTVTRAQYKSYFDWLARRPGVVASGSNANESIVVVDHPFDVLPYFPREGVPKGMLADEYTGNASMVFYVYCPGESLIHFGQKVLHYFSNMNYGYEAAVVVDEFRKTLSVHIGAETNFALPSYGWTSSRRFVGHSHPVIVSDGAGGEFAGEEYSAPSFMDVCVYASYLEQMAESGVPIMKSRVAEDLATLIVSRAGVASLRLDPRTFQEKWGGFDNFFKNAGVVRRGVCTSDMAADLGFCVEFYPTECVDAFFEKTKVMDEVHARLVRGDYGVAPDEIIAVATINSAA